MLKEKKRKKEPIRNSLRKKAFWDCKRTKELLKKNKIWRDRLLSQQKMHLIFYLKSKIDQLLSIKIWHLQLITLDHTLKNGKSVQSLLILQLCYLYKLNTNITISFTLILNSLFMWQPDILIIHFIELLKTYKIAIGI